MDLMSRVCRDCHRPAPGRVKPGKGFVCKCVRPKKRRKPTPELAAELSPNWKGKR